MDFYIDCSFLTIFRNAGCWQPASYQSEVDLGGLRPDLDLFSLLRNYLDLVLET